MSKRQEREGATNIRRWLIEIREAAGMTQGQVAEAADISQPSYCDIENGKSNPKPQTAKRIGSVLGFPWARLYEE